tara:strand:+ start:169 stop:321 length:153 start_codon:yes stop_codon:yes gene_type:complete
MLFSAQRMAVSSAAIGGDDIPEPLVILPKFTCRQARPERRSPILDWPNGH